MDAQGVQSSFTPTEVTCSNTALNWCGSERKNSENASLKVSASLLLYMYLLHSNGIFAF